MAVFIDARIPVVFAVAPSANDAVLVPEAARAARHPAACACCLGRRPAATAFDTLFLGRVRGTVPWFTRVVVPEDDPAVRATVESDPVVSARFRLASA